MTFDSAWETYENDPSLHNLIKLLKVARVYFADETIGHDTFSNVIDVVQERLEAIENVNLGG